MNNRITRAPIGRTRRVLRIDCTAHVAYWGGARCYLGDTANYRCLAALASRRGQSVDHPRMMRAIGNSFASTPEGIRIFVFRLRKKLVANGMADLAAMIVGVRGGYILRYEESNGPRNGRRFNKHTE